MARPRRPGRTREEARARAREDVVEGAADRNDLAFCSRSESIPIPFCDFLFFNFLKIFQNFEKIIFSEKCQRGVVVPRSLP